MAGVDDGECGRSQLHLPPLGFFSLVTDCDIKQHASEENHWRSEPDEDAVRGQRGSALPLEARLQFPRNSPTISGYGSGYIKHIT